MIPAELLSKVRHIEIVTNRLVNEVMAGSYHSVFKGRGMEFEEVREYQPGDEIRTIDWNVTARTGTPFVKTFVEERELTVMLMVDLSGSTEFGTGARLKSELAAEICALLAFSAIKNNDRVGLTIFTDRVEKFIPPKKGKNHVLRVIREVLAYKPEHKQTNIPAAVEHIMRVMGRKSVVFLLSDFFQTNLRKPLGILNRNHDLIALRTRDPRELEMPPVGIVPFEDPETGEVVFVDTFDEGFRTRFRNVARQSQEKQEQLFNQLKIDFVNIDTDKPYLEPIIQIFRRRASRY
ncbi:MAG: DUF58 domain-containing protein [Candidatus Sumerlaeaceae bacterium]|nr:DUF58 domain-containing protein [Candidatus Sumerlaeaceae bacterium]